MNDQNFQEDPIIPGLPQDGESSNHPRPGVLSHSWEPSQGPLTADGHDQPWPYYVSTPNTVKIQIKIREKVKMQ